MTFPDTPLDTRVELNIAGTWTDVTSYSYTREPITISYGRADEGTQVDPGQCTITLNNRDGRFSPRNPRSPYYGLLGRNTPVRVSVPGSQSYLALDGSAAGFASTPDMAVLDITGDLDVRIQARPDWYAPGVQTLIGKWTTTGDQRSWLLQLTGGSLGLSWSTDGVLSQGATWTLPTLPRTAALRATLDADNGAGGFTVRLYWAPTLAGPWTQFSVDASMTGVGTTGIFSGSSPLYVAPASPTASPPWLPMTGGVEGAEVRSGINGTIVAAPDFTTQAPGTGTFTDTAGRTWTVNAPAEISNRQYQFTGEVSSWPPKWDVSGNDVWTPIVAAGILRRLGQGRKPLASTLRRRIPSAPGLLAYWPLEEAKGATQAYSPIQGVRPMAVSGLDWEADTDLGGSAPLPKLQNPARLSASVPATSVVGWQVELVYRLETLPAAQTEILRVTVAGATMRTAILYASTAGIRVEARDEDNQIVGGFTNSNAAALAAFTGSWNRVALYTGPNGSQSFLQCAWRDVALNTYFFVAANLTTSTMGRATTVTGTWGADTEGMAIGHLTVTSTPAAGLSTSPPASTIFEGADDGFSGETALNRLARLAQEETRLPLSVLDGDSTLDSEALGPQGQDGILALLGECADTDGGILYEDREALALVYRDRSSLYNQTPALTLNYQAQGELAPPLEPVEDDQHLRNDYTVTRAGGSSGRVVIEEGPLSVLPPEDGGVGIYDESVTLSLAADAQAEQIAGWRAHLGTWDEARYPSIHVQLHTAPHLIDDVLALRIGDLGVITNPPPWLPPDDIQFLVYGYTEVIDQYTWDITMNAVPAGPWTIGITDDPQYGRADTDGCVLNGTLTATSTVVNTITTAGQRWADSATYPGDYPFTIRVGGEVILVTGCIGTGLSQTFTVGQRGVNGVTLAHDSGTPVALATPTIVAL